MPELLSLLSDQELSKTNQVDKGLCYYINKTETLQMVRATNQGVCYLECLVFPQEKVIFATLDQSHLEINSAYRSDGDQSGKVECRLLCI